MQQLFFTGSWLAEPLNVTVGAPGTSGGSSDLLLNGIPLAQAHNLSSLNISMGANTAQLHVGGIEASVTLQHAGCCFGFLDLKIAHLQLVADANSVGGLLGADDHAAVEVPPAHCSPVNFHRTSAP